ncbi:MAG TPA: UDP-glucose/GDP-mannose dehydrogenase family protein [Thioalkalivibrio sp.]|nr:UDP-glucose/GDP-mannose dehydrogenase family protein [Thioalkalivibrio sp.]
MQITVYGSGYVGLVTGTCLAEAGHHVVCVDIDAQKIDALRHNEVPIYEPGLASMVERNQAEGRLEFTLDAQLGVKHGLLQFIAVGTPPDEDGSADLRHVLDVARSIATHMDEYRVIVNKSTVPVGTARRVRAVVADTLARRGTVADFDVVSNPEFLKEGAAIGDFMRPDRVIVGVDRPQCGELMRDLYRPFVDRTDRILIMDVASAELAKYAANAMLATRISFMNELSNLAERLGADIDQVREGIGSDPRIGSHFIFAGCGYGGSCFPKDVKALIRTAHGVDYLPELLTAVENVNMRQKERLIEKITRHFAGDLAGRSLGLWGLAFKPNTDDMREAPSRRVMEALWSAGVNVKAFDPVAGEECRRLYGERRDLELCETREAALQGVDALVIVTDWDCFRLPAHDLRAALDAPVIFDGRNMFDPAEMRQAGITYYAIGRGANLQETDRHAGLLDFAMAADRRATLHA